MQAGGTGDFASAGTFNNVALVNLTADDKYFVVCAEGGTYNLATYTVSGNSGERVFETSASGEHIALNVNKSSATWFQITSAGKTFTVYKKASNEETYTSMGTYTDGMNIKLINTDSFYVVCAQGGTFNYAAASTTASNTAVTTFYFNTAYDADNYTFKPKAAGSYVVISDKTYTVYKQTGGTGDFASVGTFTGSTILTDLVATDVLQIVCANGGTYQMAFYNATGIGYKLFETSNTDCTALTMAAAGNYVIKAPGKTFTVYVGGEIYKNGESDTFTGSAVVSLEANASYYVVCAQGGAYAVKGPFAFVEIGQTYNITTKFTDTDNLMYNNTGKTITLAVSCANLFYVYKNGTDTANMTQSQYNSTQPYYRATITVEAGDWFYVKASTSNYANSSCSIVVTEA